MEREFTAVFEQDGDWVIGWAEELPGAYGQGRTLDEARDSLREAILLILEEDQAKGIDKPVIRERISVPLP